MGARKLWSHMNCFFISSVRHPHESSMRLGGHCGVTYIMSSALQLWSCSATSSRLWTTCLREETRCRHRPGCRRGRTVWKYSTEALKTMKWYLQETNRIQNKLTENTALFIRCTRKPFPLSVQLNSDQVSSLNTKVLWIVNECGFTTVQWATGEHLVSAILCEISDFYEFKALF